MIKIIGICGESSTGKDRLLAELLKKFPNDFERKISYTTRDKREGEVNGRDYYFISDKDFFNKVLHEEIIEAVDFGGEMYGTGKKSLSREKINVGIFEREGIEILSQNKEIQLLPVYLKVDEKIRFKRSMERDKDKSIDEIYDRYKLDRQVFDGIEFTVDGLIVLKNENKEDLDAAVRAVKLISSEIL